jgi:hypothetical protein
MEVKVNALRESQSMSGEDQVIDVHGGLPIK